LKNCQIDFFLRVNVFFESIFYCFIFRKVVNGLCTTLIKSLRLKQVFFDFYGALAIDYKIINDIFLCDLIVDHIFKKRG